MPSVDIDYDKIVSLRACPGREGGRETTACCEWWCRKMLLHLVGLKPHAYVCHSSPPDHRVPYNMFMQWLGLPAKSHP